MDIKYVFEPKRVDGELKKLPNIKNAVNSSPFTEGVELDSFPNLRKTKKEIFRILNNTHYDHLVSLLDCFEFSIENGFKKTSLVRAGSGEAFSSLIVELFVFEFFLRRQLNVTNYDRDQNFGDIELDYKGLKFNIEVYSPRDWAGYFDFKNELEQIIKNLDEPYDFALDIKYETISHLDPGGNLVYFNPWDFHNEMQDNPKREPYLQEITQKVIDSMKSNDKQFDYNFKGLNSKILFEFKCLRSSKNDSFVRQLGETSSIGGYCPEGMFDRLINSKVCNKALKTNKVDGCKNILMVDISRLYYCNFFDDSLRLDSFASSVKKCFDPAFGGDNQGFDAVIFFEAKRNHQIDLKTFILYVNQESLDPKVVEDIFNTSTN